MMKKVTVKQLMLLSLFMAMAWSASAQMKVGDNPNTINKGSVLELEAKDKGVLYPRVALTASNAWKPLQGTAVAGMTVYNTATVTATTSATTSLSPGFYFWEGDKWNKLATKSQVAEAGEWKDGTVSGTNLIYANQAKKAGNDVVITDDGKVGLGTVTPKSTLDIKGQLYLHHKDNPKTELNDYGHISYTTKFGRFAVGNLYGTVSGRGSVEPGDAAFWINGKNTFDKNGDRGYANGAFVAITNSNPGTTVDIVNYPNNVMIFNKEGNLGIGLKVPSERLDVNGNAKIRQMTDATTLESEYSKAVVAKPDGTLGVVSRTNPTIYNGTETILANPKELVEIMQATETFGSIKNGDVNTVGSSFFRYTGNSITLPPGKWIVHCTTLFKIGNMLEPHVNLWIRTLLSTTKQSGALLKKPEHAFTPGGTEYFSTVVTAEMSYGSGYGTFLIENTTTGNVTYYTMSSIEVQGSGAGTSTGRLYNSAKWKEESLFAIRRR